LEWCYNFGASNIGSYNAADEAACLTYYVDPVTVPADPSSYAFDCAAGCRRCEYAYDAGRWKCRASSNLIIGCAPPPTSPSA
jgi:hypothetical protein